MSDGMDGGALAEAACFSSCVRNMESVNGYYSRILLYGIAPAHKADPSIFQQRIVTSFRASRNLGKDCAGR